MKKKKREMVSLEPMTVKPSLSERTTKLPQSLLSIVKSHHQFDMSLLDHNSHLDCYLSINSLSGD